MVPGPALPVVEKLNAARIQSRPVWTPIWDLPAFSENAMVHSSDFGRRFHRHALSLPSSVSITPAEIERAIDELRSALG
jgi:dTDP-4-amino-4,6-dideoxygalactose transaminase